jgi:Protein of unknown function (DUF3072)
MARNFFLGMPRPPNFLPSIICAICGLPFIFGFWVQEQTFAMVRREFTGMNTDATPNPEKPPEQWVTGNEPMTGPQISYLQTLCREAGEEFDETLTKAEASKKIDELQARTGRGKDS